MTGTPSFNFFQGAYQNTFSQSDFKAINGNHDQTFHNGGDRGLGSFSPTDRRDYTHNDNRYATGTNNGKNGVVQFAESPGSAGQNHSSDQYNASPQGGSDATPQLNDFSPSIGNNPAPLGDTSGQGLNTVDTSRAD
ncbi:hypothetical protein VKT23_015338 [Stygiomarasmius scandens]|uniref:Uncharacterized protein n=1 Tax=Marasmiellus scandens TaxID=2682957 RepID=A0ABR1IY68_9AGAR